MKTMAASFVTIACVGVSMIAPVSAVEIIGHRGASHDAPENTLASVNLAWQRNADAVEIDVYLTSDGRIVAFHDKTTKRVGGPDKKVAEQTLAELRALDVGSWKSPNYKGEQIPLLAEILPTVPDDKRLFIEIKCGSKILGELKRVLAESRIKDSQAALIGFSLPTMEAAKNAFPRREVYWVVALKQNKVTRRWSPKVGKLIRDAKRAGVDGVDLGRLDPVDKAFVEKIKQAGLGFYCWTVNDLDEALRLQRIGVDGITTDRPGYLREQLSSGAE
jgi:glycerophosphoryl diester phosphodiesterase